MILFVYGGGWRTGDKVQYRFVAETLMREGYAVVIPNYRLVPEVRFPAFIEDLAAATAWIRGNIQRHGGDPRRLVLIGHSAGAYIAVMLALDPRYLAQHRLAPTAIAGVVGVSGPYDFHPLAGRLLREAFGGVPDAAATQPVSFARADAPPLLLLHGAADHLVSPRNSVALAERVTAAGGTARAIVYEGRGHIDIMAGLSSVLRAESPLLPDILAFLATLDRGGS